jgi:hypothetical protein
MDVMALRQRKLEQYECLIVHCYPVTGEMVMRSAPFNLKRAALCAKECSKHMHAIMAVSDDIDELNETLRLESL